MRKLLDGIVSFLLVSYSIVIISLGIYGFSSIDSDCENIKLRNSLKSFIIVGFASLTIFLSHFLCRITCFHKKGDQNLDIIPTYIYLGMMVINIIVIVYSSAIFKNSKDVCKLPKSFNVYITTLFYISILLLVFSIIVIAYRVKTSKSVSKDFYSFFAKMVNEKSGKGSADSSENSKQIRELQNMTNN